ncbi:hypothetical protein ATANTOWER_029247 [Ataeniobius toweri]|uniref:C-type lectin domain-containing protein n=1 Tax=Ataeniobius toweri TaxID=208326 RepID=A0ABU7C4M0_9TELE|nr:hypothetical protein [Ataeniobius toweri]
MKMMKSLPASGILLLLLSSRSIIVSSLGSVLVRVYKYSTNAASWENARHICKQYHTDLATFYSEADERHLYLERYFAWIGLYRDRNPQSDILLSDGEKDNLYSWENKNSPYNAECAAASYNNLFHSSTIRTHRVYGLNCGNHYYFICQDIKESQTLYKYIFIPKAKTWSEAQHYCRENHEELANIHSSVLYSAVQKEDFPIWIGLHRDGGSWNWSAGSSEYHNWKLNEPSTNGDCVSISSETHKMAAQNCGAYFPFLCISDNMVLVKEEKSWEEALEHCRRLKSSAQSNLCFDLLSLQPGEEHVYVMSKVTEAVTEEVWIGLRFLADDWLWVNGADMLHPDLPFCPAPQQNCGALSKNYAGKVKTRDCSQRKNFICYSYTST